MTGAARGRGGTAARAAAKRPWRWPTAARGRLPLYAATALLAAAIGAVLGPMLDLAPPREAPEIALLRADMAVLRDEIAALGSAAGAAAATGEALAARLDAVEGRAEALAAAAGEARAGLDGLRQRLDESEAAMAARDDRAEEALAATAARAEALLARLQRAGAGVERLDRLEASVQALQRQAGELDRELGRAPGRGAAFALALGQLRQAAAQGAAFGAELEAARALAPDGLEAEFAVLAAHAAGIASRDALARTLPAAMDAARKAERLAAADGWVEHTLARLEGLVSLRSLDGGQAGGDATAVAARARARLEAGDLEGAVAELAALAPPAAAAAAGWLAAARAHLAVHAALDGLVRSAVAALDASAP